MFLPSSWTLFHHCGSRVCGTGVGVGAQDVVSRWFSSYCFSETGSRADAVADERSTAPEDNQKRRFSNIAR